MSTVNFGGLVTGLDTESIVGALMKIERGPIDRLQREQAYIKSRLDAFSKLDGQLKAFLTKSKAIDSGAKLETAAVKSSTTGFFNVSAGTKADAGSYQIKLMALAQQQKDVSVGYASRSDAVFGTGNLSLTVGAETHSIAIAEGSNSLEGVAKAINDANLGVGATIINDGTESPFRLVLTGSDTSQTFQLDDTGLVDGSASPLAMETRQLAQQAHAIIDGIDIFSSSNTIDSAIAGLSFELLKADPDTVSSITVSADRDATLTKIKDFANAYNDIIGFFDAQKDASWGSDSSFRAIKGRLQGMLVSQQQGAGTYSSLSQLGFETQRDGKVRVNEVKLKEAMNNDFDGVVNLFAGDNDGKGITADFSSYLTSMTDGFNGLYAGRKQSTNTSLRQIDQRITSMEARLEQRENSLRAQFSAMEQLVSGLNAQSGFLMQQLSSMPSIGGRR